MSTKYPDLNEEELNLLKSLQEDDEITIGLVPVRPYVMDCFSLTGCSRPGLGVELVSELCSVLGINCRVIKESDTKFGDNITSEDGEWHGMIRYVMDQKYNTSMPSFNPTASRLDVVDFSIPVYDDITSLVTRFPPADLFSTSSVIKFPYQLVIVATFFLLGFLTLLYDTVKSQMKTLTFRKLCSAKYWINILKDTIDVGAVLFQQGPTEKRSHSLAYYLLFGLWSLCCVVLIGVYSSYVLGAAFTIKKNLPFWDIETLAECIKREECAMIAKTTSTSYYERIAAAEPGLGLFPLKEALDKHPTRIIKKEREQGSEILDDNQIYNVIILSSGQYSQMVQEYKTCTFDHARMQTYDPMAFPFHKGSKLRPLFNHAIISLREVGIIEKIYYKYVGNHINNDHCRASTIGTEPMGLITFLGAFLIIVFGVVIAGTVLALEKYLANKHGKKKGSKGHDVTGDDRSNIQSSKYYSMLSLNRNSTSLEQSKGAAVWRASQVKINNFLPTDTN